MNEELLSVLMQFKENLDFELNSLVNENNTITNPLTYIKNVGKIEILTHVINDYITPAYNHYSNDAVNKE